jgi:hypothetical protein
MIPLQPEMQREMREDSHIRQSNLPVPIGSIPSATDVSYLFYPMLTRDATHESVAHRR